MQVVQNIHDRMLVRDVDMSVSNGCWRRRIIVAIMLRALSRAI